MKNWIRLAAALCVAVLLSGLCQAQAASTPAVRTTSSIYLNDSQVSVGGYNIGGNNYFRIRDLARAFTGTGAQFEVFWNASANQVELLTGRPYTGKDESGGRISMQAESVPSTAQLLIDGRPVDVTAYNIDGSNYYKLRDLSEPLGYEVFWLAAENSICLYTGLGENACLAESSGGAARPMSASKSTARWSSNSSSYLFENADGTFTVLDASEGIVLDTYDIRTFELLGTRTLPVELEFFGGFYAGETYNYLVFGQNNTEENDQKEVIRIVKYSKDFQRLAAASITGGESFTIEPLAHGGVRLAENGNELVLHTARKRYTTEDGKNHQSQLTVLLDTTTMRVQNDLGRFQTNHVSHSFNQFVQYDGNRHVLVDHGDAYPRSVVLQRSNGKSYSETDLFEIPGSTGANCTGVTVGGFEVSDRNYLVAINTIDHSKVTTYTSFEMEGLEKDERNIVLLVCDKDSLQTRQVTLTDYINRDKLGSTPYLVKLSNDRFLILWEEFAYTDGRTASQGVRYAFVDGDGRLSGSVQSMPDARLSADCQPVLVGNTVVWYLNRMAGRLFCQIPV